jgi:hypothetical protein
VPRRGELTEVAWAGIEPLSPAGDGRGRPWRDIPERYGPWQICYERFKRWDEDGTWARLLQHMQVKDDSLGVLDLDVVAIDSLDRPRSSEFTEALIEAIAAHRHPERDLGPIPA